MTGQSASGERQGTLLAAGHFAGSRALCWRQDTLQAEGHFTGGRAHCWQLGNLMATGHFAGGNALCRRQGTYSAWQGTLQSGRALYWWQCTLQESGHMQGTSQPAGHFAVGKELCWQLRRDPVLLTSLLLL